jgi:hypothetical protein
MHYARGRFWSVEMGKIMRMDIWRAAVRRSLGRPSAFRAMYLVNGSHASHGVAQVLIHSQVRPQGTGVVNVHNVYMAMY